MEKLEEKVSFKEKEVGVLKTKRDTAKDDAKAAAEHVATGAKNAGKEPSEVDVATMIPCAACAAGASGVVLAR